VANQRYPIFCLYGFLQTKTEGLRTWRFFIYSREKQYDGRSYAIRLEQGPNDIAEALNLLAATVFNLRHEILIALEAEGEQSPVKLNGVCEFDDTYVLESRKGMPIPDGYWQEARKHGTKAQKPGSKGYALGGG
jgi:hypothetical protein